MVKNSEWENFSIKMVKDSELKCSSTYFVERVTKHVTHDVTGDVSRDSLYSRLILGWDGLRVNDLG